jgi:hypothetical protein
MDIEKNNRGFHYHAERGRREHRDGDEGICRFNRSRDAREVDPGVLR